MLRTERLILRAFGHGDLSDLNEYAQSPLVGPMAGWKPHESMEESAEALELFLAADDNWAIVRKDDLKTIGSIGLPADRKRENDEARMLAYALGAPYWGMGYMAEAAQALLAHAFQDLRLSLVSAYHYPFNQQSRRVLEKTGFKMEGALRRSQKTHNGDILDAVCYSITREEWLTRLPMIPHEEGP
ncbi:MAG: GNAT family N-acetyltransferase [Gracilibacteraceae bacterium]|nr:GNAT family N-acetyltransferase [Gracilibacteraceae bacterium]